MILTIFNGREDRKVFDMHVCSKCSQQTHVVTPPGGALTIKWLTALAVITLLWGGVFATSAHAQRGEEEFQRKMDELKKAGKKSKPNQVNESQSRAAQGTETVPGKTVMPNIGATPETCQKQYDRFRDTTNLNMTVGIIYKPGDASSRAVNRSGGLGRNKLGSEAGREELRLALTATTGGQQGTVAPKQVEWLFQSTAERYRYHNEAEVLVIVDGERIKVGNAYAMGNFPIRGEVLERLKLQAPTDLFLRIARGREVEVQIGPNEFRLEAATLSAMRDFATCANLK